MVLACCLILTACMNSSDTPSKNTEGLEEHVAQGHVRHGGGGGR